MEILSFPIGLVIGLFPVIVDLNGQPGPARLLLDGRQVCEVSARAPACMIDVGPDPRVRALDLERLDRNGKVVERIRRWINRPAAEGKIRAVGSCDDKRGQCEFQLQWAHPSKLDPSSVTVSLDGRSVRKGTEPLVRFSFNPKRPPQVLTVEAAFPDGQRADFTQLLHGSYPEKAEASLHPVPVEVAPSAGGDDLGARLRSAGWKVRAVDEGETEILFVLQPKAISRFAQATSDIARNPAMFGGALEGLGPLWFVVADESLSLMQPAVVGEHSKRWLPALITMSSRASLARIRTADAVTAGGYRLGGVPRRRIMVLVLGPRDFFEPDSSTLSSAQALEYLRRVGVPLIVWRVEVPTSAIQPPALANLAREEWPEGEWIRTSHDFPRAIARLRDVIDRQRLVWLEEAVETSALEPLLPAGVKLAGSAMSRNPAAEPQEHPLSPPSRIVYAAVPDPAEPRDIYAGTADGLLRSRDAGATWTHVETGNAGGVFSLAFAAEGRARLLAGGSGALFRSVPAEPGWSGLSLPAVFALGVNPSNPSVLYAGTRGRILKSTDGGLQWSDASSGIAATFALALAVSSRDSATVYAGTAGSGVFKSSDAGKTWHPAGAELQGTAVRSIAVSPDNPEIVYAGTDGGVFLSTDAGRFWKTAGTGLPRAITYALAIDPGNQDAPLRRDRLRALRQRARRQVLEALPGPEGARRVPRLRLRRRDGSSRGRSAKASSP